MAVTIKSPREIELMRKAGEILAQVHEELHAAVHPGMSTLDIDKLGERLIRSHGCIPSFKNYNGYPASICVSVNDEIVHGIPNKHCILKDGDIVSLDAGTIYKGYHSDAARTWGVGMDHYLQGDFYVIGEGEAQFCLDPTQKCFLRVETTDPAGGTTVYWFTGEADAKTKAVGEWLESRLVPAE